MTESSTPSTPHSYPRTLYRDQEGIWQVDEGCEALEQVTDPARRERGISQATKLVMVLNFAEAFLRIVTKRAKLVPIRFNAVQEIVIQALAYCWIQARPAQLLIPKSRQMGISTLLQALLFCLSVLCKNYRCLTVAHREDSARTIFRMSHTFLRWLPDKFTSGEKKGLETKTKGCLEWRHNGGMTQVATIGTGDGLAMGFTLNAFHGSEVAVWAQRGDAKAAWVSASPAIAENEDTLIAFESTPDGPDPFFYDLCARSLQGFGDWVAVFLPWYLDPTYRVSVEEYVLRKSRARLEEDVSVELTPEEEALVALVESQPVVAGEEWVRWPCKLELEQLLWRRLTIENKCDGDVEAFNRFYPSTWEMAFAARQAQFVTKDVVDRLKRQASFPKVMGTMGKWRGRTSVRPFDQGEAKRAKWFVQTWEKPLQGEDYILAADCGEGVEGDPSAAYVGRLDPLRGQVVIVAQIYGELDPDVYAEQLDLLGRHYNEAKLAVETNRTFEVMRQLRRLKYPNLYWRKDLSNPKSRTRIPGWNTSKATRPVAMAILKAMLRDGDVLCPDAELVDELISLQPGKGNKWAARAGKHDDRVLALAILLAVAGFRDKRGNRKEKKEDAKDTSAAAVRRRQQAWLKRLKRGSKTTGPRKSGYTA